MTEDKQPTTYEYVAEMIKAKQPDDMVAAALPKQAEVASNV
jgi:hypothetical protein